MTHKMDASPNPSVSIGYALINTNVHIKKKSVTSTAGIVAITGGAILEKSKSGKTRSVVKLIQLLFSGKTETF